MCTASAVAIGGGHPHLDVMATDNDLADELRRLGAVEDGFAHGVAGYLLSISLLGELHAKGLITRQQGAAVVERALEGLDWLDQRHKGRGLPGARRILEEILTTWRPT